MADIGVEVEVDKSDMRRVERMLDAWPKQKSRVLMRAINKTSDKARVMSVRKIAADTKLKMKDLFQRGNWRRPIVQTRASIFKLISTIRTSARRIPLIRFKAKEVYKRQTKVAKEAGAARKGKGVSYDLGRGRTTIPGAFIREVFGKGGRILAMETDRAGHKGVFVRKGESRLPIKELYGPSITHVYTGEADDIIDDAVALANEQLPKEVNTQLDLVLKQKKLKMGA